MRADERRTSTARRLVASVVLSLSLLLLPRTASAYTWMVRHGYTGCAPCHLDPSGGGVLTGYGRMVGGLVLTTDYVDTAEGDEPSSVHDFAFGVVPLPEPLLLGGAARGIWYANKYEGVQTHRDIILMQADLFAGLSIGGLRAGASIGYVSTGAFAAAITRGEEDNLVSRHHWIGYELDEKTSLFVRAGRMNLPFGIRNVEHTLWSRRMTGTSINADQQHGVAASISPGNFRAELMAVLGNFQIRPDEYRERGYSGYVEWLPTSRLALGASSLLTHRRRDDVYYKETWRHAHGIHARWATGFEPLVLLAEADYTLSSSKAEFHRKGFVGHLQADFEAFQGLHLLVTGEAHDVGAYGLPFSYGAWLSGVWFLAPHAELRLDNIYQRFGDEVGYSDSLTFVLQGHIYL
jgi:hypothetical protein